MHTDCAPLRIEMGPSDEMRDIGLNERQVATTVEARLRSARIYAPKEDARSPSPPVLWVHVGAHHDAAHITVEMRRWVTDVGNGLGAWLRVWGVAWLGQHGNDASGLLSEVSEITDIFLADYLRVNEAACGREGHPDWRYLAELALRGRMTKAQANNWGWLESVVRRVDGATTDRDELEARRELAESGAPAEAVRVVRQSQSRTN